MLVVPCPVPVEALRLPKPETGLASHELRRNLTEAKNLDFGTLNQFVIRTGY
jgi:hypothetical protein